MLCYKCNCNIPEYTLVCPRCGAEMSQRARMGFGMGPMGTNIGGFGNMNIPNVMPLGMVWFRILITFYLFWEAFSSILTGIQCITNFMSAIPGMYETLDLNISTINAKYKYIDIIYGVFLIAFGGFAVLTRFRLAKFKKNAPALLLIYFSVPTIVNCIYNIIFFTFSKEPAQSYFMLVFPLIIQGAFVYANYLYFKKRKHLFNNQENKL